MSVNDSSSLRALDCLLVGDIYTSREVMDNLTVLCDDFGARFAGTPEERKAAEFIHDTFARYGLDVHFEEYAYAGWSRGAATLEIVEPMQRALKCISLPYCPAAEVSAELVNVGCGSPDEYEAASDALRGCIVMADSSSPRALSRWVHRKEKFERAVIGGASAFLFVSESPGVGPETGSLQNDRAAPIPGISVCYEDGLFLRRLLERHGTVKLRLKTTDVNEPCTSWNVVADLAPSSPLSASERGSGGEVVVLGCHYDGHDISQGAVDPASGMVVVMEAARVLAAHARDSLKRPIRFIGWGTEEIGLIGARRYVAAHEPELDLVRFYFNLDSSGSASRKGVCLHSWPTLEPFFVDAMKDMACEHPVGQKMSAYSDHFPFVLQGVPTAGMGDCDSAPKGRGYGHTAYDTLDKVELVNLREAASVAARLALRIANADEFPAERRTTSEVEKLLATDPELEGFRVSRHLAKLRDVKCDEG